MILFVDACVRKDSRTKKLAEHLLAKLEGEVTHLALPEENLPTVDETFLAKRDGLADETVAYARQFAEADTIVIAAPFWDLSFPAILKQYLELVNVVGVTFRYNEQGIPEGMCKAKKLYYVTTAGGDFFPEEFGFGYVKALAQNFYGIPEVKLFKATGLDMVGADVEEILQEAKIRELCSVIAGGSAEKV